MILKNIFKILAFLFVFSSVLSVEIYPQSKESNIFRIIGRDFTESFNDGISVFTAPFRFSGSDWIKTGGTLAVTGAFMPFDGDIRKEFLKGHNNTKDKIADAGNFYGNALVPLVFGAGVYSGGLFLKDEYTRVTGRMIIEAVTFSGIITDVSKVVIGRSRPYSERGPDFYKLLSFKESYFSLPSGHATTAFAVSSVLSNRINNVYVSIGLYSISTLTALSRIYSDKHWASDVVLGSAIGYFVGNYISSDKPKIISKKTTLKLFPSTGGIVMQICF
ncbi:MAG: phosphatase PAP2 family protein [Ignavibacteriae bacterium]|nr:phosphatase PAP2 family protein [Ignavibacteriota bacterium]